VAAHLGFNAQCSIDLDFSLSGYNHHSFWHLISGQNVVGKFQPNANNIHHPTLRLSHKWLACSLSVFSPLGSHQRVKLVCVLPFPDGDARKDTKIYPGSGKRNPYVQRGRRVCIILHLSACTGVNTGVV